MQTKYCYWLFENALLEPERKKIKCIAKKSGYVEAATKGTNNESQKPDKKVRNTDVAFSDDQYLYDLLCPFVRTANQSSGWKYDIDYFEGVQIARYRKNQHYSWHEDGGGDHSAAYGDDASDENYIGKVRKLSLVSCISNGYEGGDLEFSLQNKDKGLVANETLYPEMKVGDVVVFPSYVFHRSTPITKGTKYSVSMWSLGPPFR